MEPNTVLQETSKKETAANLIDGKPVSKEIKDGLKEKVAGYLKAGHRAPGLAVLLIGDNPASEIYVKNKVLACKQIGIESHMHRFGADAKTETVLECICSLNEDTNIDGILVQLPLPQQLPTEEVLIAVSHDKDVDGLHPYNLGFLFAGKPGLQPCTPKGIMALLAAYKVEIRGKRAVVIGRSNLVGKPIAASSDHGLAVEHDAKPSRQILHILPSHAARARAARRRPFERLAAQFVAGKRYVVTADIAFDHGEIFVLAATVKAEP